MGFYPWGHSDWCKFQTNFMLQISLIFCFAWILAIRKNTDLKSCRNINWGHLKYKQLSCVTKVTFKTYVKLPEKYEVTLKDNIAKVTLRKTKNSFIHSECTLILATLFSDLLTSFLRSLDLLLVTWRNICNTAIFEYCTLRHVTS